MFRPRGAEREYRPNLEHRPLQSTCIGRVVPLLGDDYPITARTYVLYSPGVVIVPRPDTRGPEVDRDGRPRIMIVDGQTLFVDALAGIQGRPPLSAVTRTASRSDQAVQMLNSSRADLVLCDVKVQPLPLRSFLAQVRDAPGAPPVVLLGDAEDEASLVARSEEHTSELQS